jgi:hypothetical protein
LCSALGVVVAVVLVKAVSLLCASESSLSWSSSSLGLCCSVCCWLGLGVTVPLLDLYTGLVLFLCFAVLLSHACLSLG